MATDDSVDHPLSPRRPPTTPQQAFDCWGRPIHSSSRGGWKAASFFLCSHSMHSLAVHGCTVNLVIFLTRVLRQDTVVAASAVTNWIGTSFLSSLIGASLGDANFGRLWSCVIYLTLLVMGLITFAITGSIVSEQPPRSCPKPPCYHETVGSLAHVTVFYIGLYMIGLGNASLSPNLVSFGADQLDLPRQKSTFISMFMASGCVGTLVSITVIGYLENEGRWSLGFWLSCGAGILAILFFLAGIPNARRYNSGENPLLRIARVVVAALRNRRESMPSIYKPMLEVSSELEQPMIRRTDSLRWLDKAAATKRNRLGQHDSDDSDCTMAQVEDVKKVCRLIPFWVCGIFLSAVSVQKHTLFLLQGATMDNHLGSLEIPPSSMGAFHLVTFVVGAPLYSLVLVPWIVRCRRDRKEITSTERMFAGLVVATAGTSVAAIVEWQRRKTAEKARQGEMPTLPQLLPMSIFWLVPQYVIEGWTGVLFNCGHLEFNYAESPEGMRSLASAFSMTGSALGSYLSSAMVEAVTAITSRGGRGGWIPKSFEEEEGHLDYFYWLQDVVVVFTLVLFVVFARWLREGNLQDDDENQQQDKGQYLKPLC